MDLIRDIKDKQRIGLLDYRWDARSYLLDTKIPNQQMIKIIGAPFVYIAKHQKQIQKDKSLHAVCQLCTDVDHVVNIKRRDHRLAFLAQLFNQLVNSDRSLYMCYDCGTVARGVFLQLINAYRGRLTLSRPELDRLHRDYYMNRYHGAQGVEVLHDNVHKIKQNCLFLCALQHGEDSGHIYVIDKTYLAGQSHPRYRIYQSCLNAYLLVDYVESMDYGRDISVGVDIDQHLNHLHHLLSTLIWKQPEIDVFIKWYKFYPHSGASPKDKKLFTSTYIIYGDTK
jgi:hypothetical protein